MTQQAPSIPTPHRRARFLDRLDAAVASLTDAGEVTRIACDLLRDDLRASRCIYAELSQREHESSSFGEEQEHFTFPAPAIRPREFSDAAMISLRAGLTFVIENTETDPRIAASRESYRQADVQALVCVPVPKNQPLAAALAVHSQEARHWTAQEIDLIEQVAVRCWESTVHLATLQELRESEENLRLAMEAANFGYYAYELGAPHIKISHRFARIFGYDQTPEDWTFDRWVEHLHPEDRDGILDVVQTSELHNSSIEYESRIFPAGVERTEGNVRWVWLRARYSHRESGRRYRFGVIADITERKQAEAALEASRREAYRQWTELEAIYQTAPIGLSLYSADEFRYLRVNDVQMGVIGLPQDQIIGRPFREIAPALWPACEPILRRVAAGETIRNVMLEGELSTRPGQHRYWTVSYMPVRGEDGTIRAVGAVIMETTAQKRAEQALIQSEKLAAVGRLASSISHEINNPLEAITNLLYLAQHTEGLPQEAADALILAEKELMRVSQIASQTLRFHRQATKPTWVTAVDLLKPVVALYQGRLTNSNLRLVEEHQSAEPVQCFENDIRQVLNNLIGNAIDAMKNVGGRVLIRSREATDWKTGRRGLRITVADSGSGMSETTRRSIFTAFYTTKEINGTGLGLWISFGIVGKHEGVLRFYSSDRPGHSGTVFSLFLPRYG